MRFSGYTIWKFNNELKGNIARWGKQSFVVFFNKIYKKDEMEIIEWFKKLKCNKIELDGLKSIDENIKIILSEIL